MWFHFSFVVVSSNYELLVLLVTNWILTQSPQPYILTLGFFHFGQKFWIAYKYMEQDSIDDGWSETGTRMNCLINATRLELENA